MDRFSELQAFVAVVDTGGFAAAGRRLGLSRSAVNRLVIGLEGRLGAQLLNRTTRRVSTTSDGRAFVERARGVLAELDDAEAAIGAVRGEAIGRLRVSGPIREDPIDLSSAVRDFLAAHPKVQIELNLEARIVDPVAEGYDMVVRVGEPDEQTPFVDHRLSAFEYVVCAAPTYLATFGEPRSPSELRAHRLLHFSGDPSVSVWRFVGPEGTVQTPVEGPLSSNSIEAVRMAALAGLGVAVLPNIAVADAFKAGRLTRILADQKLPERVLQVIYPPSRRLSAKVRLFTDFLIERFSAAE